MRAFAGTTVLPVRVDLLYVPNLRVPLGAGRPPLVAKAKLVWRVSGQTRPGGRVHTVGLLDFVTGIGLLWVYAAIRPRFGPGAKTAVIAGVAVWFFVGLLHALGEGPMGLFPEKVYTVGTIVALVQYAVAGAVGAYVYKEM